MYSGTTFRNKSGRIIGTHQKFDRAARLILKDMIPKRRFFPAIADILHFEGRNGPDGIKSKSPSKDEPWHYINPLKYDDTELIGLVTDHHTNLVQALSEDNRVRAAFEAAWLAHAITDGLTPAHHYPLAEKIEELWGHPKEMRTTVKAKNIIPAINNVDRLSKNWQYWGAKGVFTSHFMFEWGVATTVSPMRLHKKIPSSNHMVRAKKDGIVPLFEEAVHMVFDLGMYEEFYKKGWTRRLAQHTRKKLAPATIELIALSWYSASERAAVLRSVKK